MSEKLTKFILGANKMKGVQPFVGNILAIDPGETTGFAVFRGTRSPEGIYRYDWIEIDQCKTWPESVCVANLTILFNQAKPDLMVNESYRIYDWKSNDHKWSPVRTTQIIGSLWTFCLQRNIPRYEQSAQNAKGFWTDERLSEYNLYFSAIRHGRDATRHALHFLCFGPPKSQEK